ncbi:hypothetical protein NDU88_004331 [Pleurodeles waltl]|uniref:Secreted protein n=1 Tax=Pleurodeles waltl TaxID=8319 RepID=A0AAV7RFF1_PLEWA|nr:hypothetical protein NDU88_004331 [Pleurodeles waltl]
MCAVRFAAVCTFVRIAARHSAFSFRFSGTPGLDLPLPGLDSAARVGSSPPVVGCTCSAPIAWTSGLISGPPLSVLAGPEHLHPAVGTTGSQSHRAWRAQQLWSPVTGWGARPLLPRSCFTSSEHPQVLKAACPAPRQVCRSTTAAAASVLRRGTAPSVFASPDLLGLSLSLPGLGCAACRNSS